MKEDEKETPFGAIKGLSIDQQTSIVTIKPSLEGSTKFFAMAKTASGHMIWKEIKITKKTLKKEQTEEVEKIDQEELEKQLNKSAEAAELMSESLRNDLPVFKEALPKRVVFDLDFQGPHIYISPMAIDKDNHTIKMNFVNMTAHPFFIMRALPNSTFKLVLEETLVTDEDLGEHLILIELNDEIDITKSTEYGLLVEVVKHEGTGHPDATHEQKVDDIVNLRNGVALPNVAPAAVLKAMRRAFENEGILIPDPKLTIKDITSNGTVKMEFN